jgi:uncharacterized protein
METAVLNPGAATAPNQIINLLIAQFKPLHIYQFAQLCWQDQCDSIFTAARKGNRFVYYLLVITEGSASVENEIQAFMDRQNTEDKFVVHAHGEEILRRNLKACNAYFTSVLNRGVLLYSANGLVAQGKVQAPNPKRELLRLRAHWHHRSGMARGFMEAAEQALDNNRDKMCVFLLHHACEQLCVGLIWVNMGYKSDIRNLQRLLYVCGCFSAEPLMHFMGTQATEVLLHIMMKSFHQARYNDNYNLNGHSPYRFLELAEGFATLCEGLCKERFAVMEKGIAAS